MTLQFDIATITFDVPELLVEYEEEGYTLVHCSYWSSHIYINGGWVTIWPTTHLVHKLSNESIELINIIGIPLAPQKHWFQRKGEYFPFTLVFPKVPKHWIQFDLIEITPDNSGFKVYNIKRNKKGVYRVMVK